MQKLFGKQKISPRIWEFRRRLFTGKFGWQILKFWNFADANLFRRPKFLNFFSAFVAQTLGLLLQFRGKKVIKKVERNDSENYFIFGGTLSVKREGKEKFSR